SRALNNPVARGVARFTGKYADRLLAGPVFPVQNWYAYIQVMQAFMAGNDTRASLASIKVPTTLMIGAQSRFFSTDGQLEIQRHVRHAEVIRCERFGHIPRSDLPVQFPRQFSRFVDQ